MDDAIGKAAAKLAAKSLGLCVTNEPVPGRSVRHTALFAEGGGLQAVIKVGPPNHHESMGSEVKWASSLSAHGISVARPLGEGFHLVHIQDSAYPVSVWRREPGTHQPADDASLRDLGRTLRKIHYCRIRPPTSYQPSMPLVWRSRWQNLRSSIAENSNHPWHDRADLLEWFDTLVADTTARILSADHYTHPRTLCHGDVDFDNILFTAGRAVLIDLEVTGYQPQNRDFATLLQCVVEERFSLTQLRQVLEGYGPDLPSRATILPMGPVRHVVGVMHQAERANAGRLSPAALEHSVSTLRRHPEGRPEWLHLVNSLFPE